MFIQCYKNITFIVCYVFIKMSDRKKTISENRKYFEYFSKSFCIKIDINAPDKIYYDEPFETEL